MPEIRIPLPRDFQFEHSLTFLQRSPRELLHRVHEDRVTKAVNIQGKLVVLSVNSTGDQLCATYQGDGVSAGDVRDYVTAWFDLDRDLKPFYQMASEDELLAPIAKAYRGYRMVSIPDLFEALSWAIIGQQINLAFAYTLKARLVEAFGKQVNHNGQVLFAFPEPHVLANLDPQQLLAMQFSRQKAAYIIHLSNLIVQGGVHQQQLASLSFKEAREALIRIKGVGNWTANYVLMKTFRFPEAFPLEDAGLHQAIRNKLQMRRKPALSRVRKIFRNYRGWEAYATLYLWKSLES